MKPLRRISQFMRRKKVPLLVHSSTEERVLAPRSESSPIRMPALLPAPGSSEPEPTIGPDTENNPPSDPTVASSSSLGLPVEIWQEIFKLAIVLLVSPFDADHELQYDTSPLSVLSWGPPSIITSFYQLQHPKVFSMRRSLVLVCRLWYKMGISALYSHILIDFDSTAKVQSLQQALESNPALAKTVVRLSVTKRRHKRLLPETPYDGSYPDMSNPYRIIQHEELPKNHQHRHLFNKIIPHLTQLRVVSCTDIFAYWTDMPKFPELCIIYWPPPSALTSSFGYDIISKKPYFWTHVTTLSFSMKSEPWHSQYSRLPDGQGPVFITFPNLISLKLNARYASAMSWISEYWDIPKLRYLSATGGSAVFWFLFVERYAASLEYLELLSAPGYVFRHVDPSAIDMPRLKSLCLGVHPKYDPIDSIQKAIDNIRAPHLRHFAIHIPLGHLSDYQHTYLVGKMKAGMRAYPTATKIGLYHARGCTSSLSWNRVEDAVDDWKRRGLIVETRVVRTEGKSI